MHDDITVSCLNVQMHNKNEPQVKLNFGVSKMADISVLHKPNITFHNE